MLDLLMVATLLLGSTALGAAFIVSGVLGVLLGCATAFYSFRPATTWYGLRLLRAGTLSALFGTTLLLLLVRPVRDDLDVLIFPVAPAFFAWGALIPATLHFKYRARQLDEPI